jgi:hypothetical protein
LRVGATLTARERRLDVFTNTERYVECSTTVGQTITSGQVDEKRAEWARHVRERQRRRA